MREVSWKDSLTSSESLVCSCSKKEGRDNYAL